MRAASAGSGCAGGRCFAAPQRRLTQRNAADRLPAEEAVDPFEDDRRQMLDFERRRAFNPQHQGGGFGRLFADRRAAS